MLVFITHPKYFDKRKIAKKNVDLVYVFGSQKLFSELSPKYKCVNIGVDGKIKNENFFPEARKYKKATKEKFLSIKISALGYFKKKRTYYYRRKYEMMNLHDPLFNLNVNAAKKQKDFNEAAKIIDDMIVRYVSQIFEVEKGNDFVNKYFNFIEILLNISKSFFRSYVYANDFKRGYEIFADVFTYNFFNKAVLFYTFGKYDLYKNTFHYNYLKILSRLFIEEIHKNDIIYFVKNNEKYYKDKGWL